MNELLAEYKHLINFDDKMQKSNFKFVETYLKFYSRKKRAGWEQDCVEFLKGAIDLQKHFLANLKKMR